MGNAMYRNKNRSRRVQKRVNRRRNEKNTIGQNVTYILAYLIQIETRFNELNKPKLKVCLRKNNFVNQSLTKPLNVNKRTSTIITKKNQNIFFQFRAQYTRTSTHSYT